MPIRSFEGDDRVHGTHSLAGQGAPAGPAAETVDRSGGAEGRDRTLLLWLTNSAHATNHFQNAMLTILYPIMMTDLGFGYAQVGVLTAVQGTFGNATQAFYGFLAQFARRTHLLGIGNMILGLGVFLTGLVPSYPFLILARVAGYQDDDAGALWARGDREAVIQSVRRQVAAELLLDVSDTAIDKQRPCRVPAPEVAQQRRGAVSLDPERRRPAVAGADDLDTGALDEILAQENDVGRCHAGIGAGARDEALGPTRGSSDLVRRRSNRGDALP